MNPVGRRRIGFDLGRSFAVAAILAGAFAAQLTSAGENQGISKEAGRSPASLVGSPQLRNPVSLAPSWYTDPSALVEERGAMRHAPLGLGRNSFELQPQAGGDLKQANFSDSFRRRLYWDPSH